MYTRKLENGLTLIGAIIMLFGVMSAINTALADDASVGQDSLKTEVSASS